MFVCFRVDASVLMGTGHLMRCLTLANELQKQGARINFISRLLPGNLCDIIEDRGHFLYRLPYDAPVSDYTGGSDEYDKWLGVTWQTDAQQTVQAIGDTRQVDWLVVDSYSLDSRWQQYVKNYTGRIMVIDDLANRSHSCDLLLDQNYYSNMESRYHGLIPSACKSLLGPKFALLRPEFLEARRKLRKRSGIIERMFIFFGGSDATNETEKALQAIRLLNRTDLAVDVVVGATNPHRERIKLLCSQMINVKFHCQVANIAELMLSADIAIGAGGSTTWERCCVGLPSMVTVLAENQFEITEAARQKKVVINMGWADQLTPEHYRRAILASDSSVLCEMSENALDLVDGEGCQRVCNILLSM